jgi:hypothetical protein
MIVAEKSWLQRFNNASGMTTKQSDVLCTLVSGNSLPKRTLYSNKDLTVISARRPVIINGVSVVAERADLLSRVIPIHLLTPRAPKETDSDCKPHRTETDLAADLQQHRPQILGALYDAIAVAIKTLPSITIEDPPRLHDFVKWATAAESGLGLATGAVVAALSNSRVEAAANALDASPLPRHLLGVVRLHRGSWKASPTEWLDALNSLAGPLAKHIKGWPKDAKDFGEQLALLQPDLVSMNLFAKYKRARGKRYWTIFETKSQPTTQEEGADGVPTE